MVSQEMVAMGKNGCIIRDIHEYYLQRSAEIGAENVYNFSLGNPSIPTPPIVDQTMRRLFEEVDPITLHSYTSAAGDMGVRKKLAENITARFGVKADPGKIYMTCGAAASLAITLKAITVAGDEVILLDENYNADRMAKEIDSIGYEIVCGITHRVPRIYVNG